jgi:ubiquinone/menaquinone biosynthesis C-methylase UbiE
MSSPFKYPGNELGLFAGAKNWKKYFSRCIQPYIGNNVVEAGAGIGSTALLLNNGTSGEWLMLEPDNEMAAILHLKLAGNEFPKNCSVLNGTISNLTRKFDTILYIDVLEHIEKDKEELAKAASLLEGNGHLVVLAPAFQFLFSPFDKAIGHYRRYNKKALKEVSPPGMKIIHNSYYDSAGFGAAMMNKLFLRQKYPTAGQVKFWDNYLVPISKLTDKLCLHSLGKSIICVWKKEK